MTTNIAEIRSKLLKLVSSDDNRAFVVVASIINYNYFFDYSIIDK